MERVLKKMDMTATKRVMQPAHGIQQLFAISAIFRSNGEAQSSAGHGKNFITDVVIAYGVVALTPRKHSIVYKFC